MILPFIISLSLRYDKIEKFSKKQKKKNSSNKSKSSIEKKENDFALLYFSRDNELSLKQVALLQKNVRTKSNSGGFASWGKLALMI